MNDRQYYKVVCDEVGLLLLVRHLTMEEEKTEYYAIKKKIGSLKKPISIESYQKFVLNKFLHKPDEFFANLPEDDDKLTIIKAVYQSIIEAYPPFDLLFVCADLNNGSLIEDIQEHLGELFSKGSMSAGPPQAPNPKAMNTLDDLNALKRYLSKNLIGQEEAVDGVVDTVKLIASGLYKTSSFFFIGPTGVGKTELAKLLGKKYSGNFWKVNCAEYANAHEYAKLIGSPPGYVGHTDSSIMAEKAEKSNRWVILFDEIEKAHHKFYDFLLSLLDDGNCTDNMGRVLDFSESIFIFTSNQGVSDFGGRKVGFDKAVVSLSGCKDEIKESVKKKFPAEFMNRIDNYVFFNTLDKDNVRKIATLALRGIPIKKYKALLDYIVEEGYSEEYGARNIKRFIKNKVATQVAQKLLERRVPKKRGDMYTPKIIDGKLHIIDLRDEKTKDQSAE